MIRQLIVLALCAGVATPAVAGPLQESATAAVRHAAAQQAPVRPVSTTGGHRGSKWAGAILIAAGMGNATYGFLHTTDGDYVEPGDASKLSNNGVGIGGLALAAGGGAVMFLSTRHTSPSATAGRPALTVAKRISW